MTTASGYMSFEWMFIALDLDALDPVEGDVAVVEGVRVEAMR
jgi:hypothetical protein